MLNGKWLKSHSFRLLKNKKKKLIKVGDLFPFVIEVPLDISSCFSPSKFMRSSRQQLGSTETYILIEEEFS